MAETASASEPFPEAPTLRVVESQQPDQLPVAEIDLEYLTSTGLVQAIGARNEQ